MAGYLPHLLLIGLLSLHHNQYYYHCNSLFKHKQAIISFQTNVSINMGVHYRSEKYFTSPELFMPERWLRGGAADSVHPYIHTPFGFGTRTCAGNLNLYSLLI